jgi:hypothetical protein
MSGTTTNDLVERVARLCTCHPSEAPVPCRKQYAFLDCIRAEARAIALEEAAKVAEKMLMSYDTMDKIPEAIRGMIKD